MDLPTPIRVKRPKRFETQQATLTGLESSLFSRAPEDANRNFIQVT